MSHIIRQFHHAKVKVVEGGTTRHRSIFKGLQAFSESAEGPVLPRPKVVIIHDAVRPFVEEDFLLKITLAAKEQGVWSILPEQMLTCLASHLLLHIHFLATVTETPYAFVFNYLPTAVCNIMQALITINV